MNTIELLVVDDNAAETLLLFYALEDCPAPVKVHFAKDGAEALQMLGERDVRSCHPGSESSRAVGI